MFRLGDNGIVLVGEAKLIDGSVGGQPRGTQILYNIVTENGIWGKQVDFPSQQGGIATPSALKTFPLDKKLDFYL